MLGSHKINYAAYSRNHEARMRVEKRRQENYLKCQRLVADLTRKYLNRGK